jgi:hypothetical protein
VPDHSRHRLEQAGLGRPPIPDNSTHESRSV